MDDPVEELAYRENDGIEVTLLWHAAADRLTVSLFDARSGEHFELEAPRGKALDVFHHPYFYAAASSAHCSATALISRGACKSPTWSETA